MGNRLTLYFTSDTHGYLYPTNFANPVPRAQGLFCMHFPKDGNTLVIDGGDTIQGSPLTYYCHKHHKPMPVAAVLNQLGYDYVTLGNHDFNYGTGALHKYLTTLQARCLCANVKDQAGMLPIGNYTVHTLQNGLRIGLVGIVTNWVNLWEKPENIAGLTISDPYEATYEAIVALQGKVDLLVGIYHGGFECDLATEKRLSHTDENIGCRLCEAFPFDVLLTGHQHIPMANQTYHGTHIVQTPCNATAYCKLVVDAQGSITSELCVPDATVALLPWQQRLYADLSTWLDQPIGRLSQPIWPTDKLTMALRGTPIATFFNRVQLEASGAEISCTSLGNELRGFDRIVTVRDVVASYVYTNTLVVLEVTGRVLREALEQCASYFAVDKAGEVRIALSFLQPKVAHYNYDYFEGIHYTFDLRLPVGNRVTMLQREGKAIDPDDHFSLVMNNYRSTGAGDFEEYAACPHIREMQTEVSELILNYLGDHEQIELASDAAYTVIPPNGAQA